MPHTRKHPAGRLRLAPVLLVALLTACAVPTPMRVDAPIDTAVRAAPAAPAGPSMRQGACAGMRAPFMRTSPEPAVRHSSCTKASCRCTWISHW